MSGPVASPVPPANPAASVSSAVKLAVLLATPLSVDTVLDAVCGPAVGGVGLFVGLVREHDGGRGVDALSYTAHPSAQTELARCAERVAERFAVPAVAVAHRTGALSVGDLAVVVAAGAAHRGPALAACQALIDDLKTTVPIWKEQHFAGGEVEWVGLP
ncbi:MAG: molybdopterin synthase catalytic subunit [Propionibacteriaceae bacterium]